MQAPKKVLDEYQENLLKYIQKYGSKWSLSLPHAILEVIGDLKIICKHLNYNFKEMCDDPYIN